MTDPQAQIAQVFRDVRQERQAIEREIGSDDYGFGGNSMPTKQAERSLNKGLAQGQALVVSSDKKFDKVVRRAIASSSSGIAPIVYIQLYLDYIRDIRVEAERLKRKGDIHYAWGFHNGARAGLSQVDVLNMRAIQGMFVEQVSSVMTQELFN